MSPQAKVCPNQRPAGNMPLWDGDLGVHSPVRISWLPMARVQLWYFYMLLLEVLLGPALWLSAPPLGSRLVRFEPLSVQDQHPDSRLRKRSSFEIELHSVLASSTNGANGAETRPHRVEIPRAHSRPSNFQGLCLRG